MLVVWNFIKKILNAELRVDTNDGRKKYLNQDKINMLVIDRNINGMEFSAIGIKYGVTTIVAKKLYKKVMIKKFEKDSQ